MVFLTPYPLVLVGVVCCREELDRLGERGALGLGSGSILGSHLRECSPAVIPRADHCSVAAARCDYSRSFQFFVGPRDGVRCYVEDAGEVAYRRQFGSNREYPGIGQFNDAEPELLE